MRPRAYIAKVADPEGATHEYRFDARTRRGARRQAREWVACTDWDATLVGIEREVNPRWGARHRRLLAVAGVTFVASGIAISAIMIIGLSLEGGL
jgi:hypothetical protein